MAAALLALSGCAQDKSDIVVTKNYLPSTMAVPGECWRVLLETHDKQLKPICVTKIKWDKLKKGQHYHG